VERIKRAHQEKQKFRIIVVVPVAPGFEGDFIQVDRRSMPLRLVHTILINTMSLPPNACRRIDRSVAQYQYRSISRGKHSVFEQLRTANIPIKDYIGFYSLRNWGKVKTSTAATIATATTTTSRKESNGSSTIVNKDGSNILQSPLPNSKRNIINKTRGLAKSKSSSQTKLAEDLLKQQQLQQQQLLEQQKNVYNDGRLDFLTEQVYIHSKLMIVDDKTVICGSGNVSKCFFYFT
jgi:phosphatidylserine/phosphatidylglycerophosphate/cardiolipin synthase-like enzyme